MSDALHGRALLARVVNEHRRTLITLIAALAVNILVYLFVVYPLSQRVANIEQRDRAAEQALAAAREEHAQARGTVTGKDRAAQELAAFYERVLPRGMAGARRLTFPRLADLAAQSNLRYEHVERELVEKRDSMLTQMKMQAQLSGSYADMRTFIYQLETAPEFIVIDNIELTEGSDTGTLAVAVELSTYYRTPR